MSPSRRDFIRTTGVAAAALAAHPRLFVEPAAQTLTAPPPDPVAISLANAALNAIVDFQDFLFQPFAFGDVPHNHETMRDAAMPVANRAEAPFHPMFAPAVVI